MNTYDIAFEINSELFGGDEYVDEEDVIKVQKILEQRLKSSQVDTLVMRGDEDTMVLRSPSRIYWDPKKDIETYEMASAMQILLFMISGGDTWSAEKMIDEAPKEVSRHFRIEA